MAFLATLVSRSSNHDYHKLTEPGAFAEDPTMNTTTPLEDSETEAELSEAEIAIDERSTKVNKDLSKYIRPATQSRN